MDFHVDDNDDGPDQEHNDTSLHVGRVWSGPWTPGLPQPEQVQQGAARQHDFVLHGPLAHACEHFPCLADVVVGTSQLRERQRSLRTRESGEQKESGSGNRSLTGRVGPPTHVFAGVENRVALRVQILQDANPDLLRVQQRLGCLPDAI